MSELNQLQDLLDQEADEKLDAEWEEHRNKAFRAVFPESGLTGMLIEVSPGQQKVHAHALLQKILDAQKARLRPVVRKQRTADFLNAVKALEAKHDQD